ncbi:MAG: hypothetical protein WBP93_08535 [Pyrinomonadaceae bacterium]
MLKQFTLCLMLMLLCIMGVVSQSRRQITTKVQQDIVQQMVRDGQIQSTCVQEEGGESKVVDIGTVNLNRDGKPEYEIYGHGCACNGGRRCDQWLYRQTASGYELLLGPLQVDGFDVKKSLTNGYFDIAIASPAGNDYFVELYKYDGSRYQLRECEDCVYIGRRRGSTHKCTRVKCPQ